jgi:hypothetical protein
LNQNTKHQKHYLLIKKFAELGINGWIQEITAWHGNPTPRNGIVIDSKP